MKHKIKSWYIITCLVIITLGFSAGLYEQYWPIKIIDIHSPVHVKTSVVHAGEVMIYTADYCLYKTYPATVSRTLLNDSTILLPIVKSVGSLGCHKSDIQVPIPAGAEPGEYHMEGIVQYQITPTRIINVSFSSDKFKVIK